MLRWLLIIFLIINVIRVNVESSEHFDALDRKWSLRLLIITHLNLLAGIYLYFFGSNGISIIDEQKYTMKDVMHTSWLRFWIIEHPIMMLTSIVLITIAHSYSKKDILPIKKHRTMSTLYLIALAIIFLAIPWPFRMEGIQRPIFRALY